ncbi:HNH endonuclease [Paenibacillus anaericanus]|uniref:HNH endonuclease n=1 Tax=Paenibacillus anaericanus TaxID=170367 RepID=A0A3S1C715_9BACL|nr:HNH endonuclease signature motif containing protein [Paenibacillus anaericanus]RUT44675.1 HNH endonuclease [Paenibacillus anaericanus]
MRLHGDVKLVRRTNLVQENDYAKYRTSLLEDFGDICGYCGKSIRLANKGFEIDHFVPVSIDKTRETDYTNLVMSCFVCNRKKGKKWPTNNKELCHDERQGFVDPVIEEFDTHLGRDQSGAIEYYTDVGAYMYGVFKFKLRPTSHVWKSMELVKCKEQLYQIKKESIQFSVDEMEQFIDIQEELDNLLEYLLGKGE